MLKKSVRIQLFDDSGMVSDRLISQVSEFYLGPKEKHEGPLRIEFTFEEKSDVEQAITYLNKLVGYMPIKSEPKVRGRKPLNQNSDYKDIGEDKEQIIEKLIKESSNQDELINKLREMGFIFMTSDYLKHFIPDTYKIKGIHLDAYDWLIRRIREAKTPMNDKFDPQVLLGVKISSERSPKLVKYIYGEYKGKNELVIPSKKAITFGKTNLMKFPMYMNEEERLKWGTEHRTLFQNPDKKPSKFYLRWYKDIKVGDELKIEEDNLLQRLIKDATKTT
jgi:hypothetical protein